MGAVMSAFSKVGVSAGQRKLALDDGPQDRFLAFGVLLVGHLAGPHPGDRATQMGVRVAAPEHGDHLDRLNAPAVAGRGAPLLWPRQLPVCVGSAIAVLASHVVDGATAAQEGRVGLLEDPPHNRIEQTHGAAEDAHAFRPLAGAFVGPGAKIAAMTEDVCRPGREILGHASIIPRPRRGSRRRRNPAPVPGMGWFAACKGPQGNEFGLPKTGPSVLGPAR